MAGERRPVSGEYALVPATTSGSKIHAVVRPEKALTAGIAQRAGSNGIDDALLHARRGVDVEAIARYMY